MCESVSIDVLDISNWLAADGTFNQSPGTAITCYVVATWTEDSRYFRVHAHLAETLVLDVEE